MNQELDDLSAGKLVEILRNPVVVLNGRGQIISMNSAAEDLLGQSEIVGHHIIHPGYLTRDAPKETRKTKKRFNTWLKEGAIVPDEYAIHPRSGDAILVTISGTILKDERGKTRCVIAILHESEKRFREFFERAPSYFYMISPEGVILDINHSALQVLGYTKEELVGLPVKTIYASECWPKVDELLEKFKREGYLEDEEMVLISKQDSRQTVLVSTELAHDGEGELQYSLCVQRNITERKIIEMALKKSEEELALKNKIADVFLTVSDEEMYNEVLDIFLKALNSTFGVFGFIREDGDLIVPSLTRHVWDKCQVSDKSMVFPRDNWSDSTWAQCIIQKRTICQNKPSTKTPPGHIKITRHISVPIIHQDKVIGLFQVANRDTDYDEGDIKKLESIARHVAPILRERLGREQIDEAILRKTRLLAAINRIFQDTLNDTTDAEVAQTSLEVAEELTGSKFGFLGELNERGNFDTIALSNPGWDECSVPETQAARLILDMEVRGFQFQPLVDGNSLIVDDIASHPDSMGTPEGHPPVVNFLGVPLKRAGKVVGTLGLANSEDGYNLADQEDIEALTIAIIEALFRKRQDIALQRMNEELETRVNERTRELQDAQEQLIRSERLAVLGQLSGGIGHELRNPLGAIKSAVYFLKMVLKDPDSKVREVLDILETEVIASDRIIISLLDFARPESSTRQRVLVTEVVDTALTRVKIPENIEVVTQLDPDVPVILADPEQLIRIFINISLNAIQAMPDGGMLSIVSKTTELGWLAISFTDTGIGMSDEILANVFEPLFTTKPKGIGLGLPIAKMMVEAHGGVINVESIEGKGTTFTIELPTYLMALEELNE